MAGRTSFLKVLEKIVKSGITVKKLKNREFERILVCRNLSLPLKAGGL